MRLYADLLARLLDEVGQVEIVEQPLPDVDVVVFLMNGEGRPSEELQLEAQHRAKLVALAPKGDHGFVRLPEEPEWREIRPFGLIRVLLEVLAGREHLWTGKEFPKT